MCRACVWVLLIIAAVAGSGCGNKMPRVERLHHNGKIYLEHRRYDDAIRELREALEEDSAHRPSRLLLGRALALKGDTEGGVAEFDRLIEADPSDPEPYLEKAQAFFRRMQWESVLRVCEDLHARLPREARAEALAGRALIQMKDPARAEAAFRTAVEEQPGLVEAHVGLAEAVLLQNRAEEAKRIALYVIETLDPRAFQAHVVLGQVLTLERRFDEALSHVVKAVSLQPDNIGAQMMEADLLVRQGRTEEALDRARALEGRRRSFAHYVRGSVYLEQRKYLEASTELAEALKGDPDLVEARIRLALAYHGRGNTQLAISGLVELVNTQPELHEVRIKLAALYFEQKSYADAVRHATIVIEKQPDDPAATELLVLALDAQGESEAARNTALEFCRHQRAAQRPDAALWVISGYLRVHADDVDLLNQKGLALVQKGDLDGASAAFRRVLAIDPERGEAVQNLVSTLTLARDYQGATAAGDAWLARHPDDARITIALANAALAHNSHAEARRLLETVPRNAPEYVPARLLAIEALVAEGDLERAIAACETLLDERPDTTAALVLLADLFRAQEMIPQAVAALERAVERRPALYVARAVLVELHLRSGRDDAAREQIAAVLTREAPFARGEGLAETLEKTESAGAALRTVFEADRTNAVTALALGEWYLRQGQTDLAEGVASDLVGEEPPDVAVRAFLRGSVAIAEGRLEEGIRALGEAVSASPEWIEARLRLARAQERAGQFEEARQQYDGILARMPHHSTALLCQAALFLVEERPEEAAVRAERVVRYHEGLRARSVLVSALLLLGQAQAQAGRTEDAMRTFDQLRQIEPRAPRSALLLATLRLAQGDAEGALSVCSEELARDPDAAEFHTLAGRIRLQRGELGEAAKSFEEAMRLDPASVPARIGTAEVHLAAKRLEDAEKAFRGVLDKDSLNVKALIGLARTLRAGGRAADAVALLRQAAGSIPQSAEIARALAEELRAGGDLEGALGEYRRVLKISTGVRLRAVAANNVAWLMFLSSGDLDAALGPAEEAYSLAPTSPAVLDTLGWLLTKKGETERGVNLLRDAVALDPKNATIQYHLGEALRSTGEIEPARQALQEALRLDPAFPEADAARRALDQLGVPR